MNNKGKIRLASVLYIIAIIAILAIGLNVYSEYNFYDYVKGVREEGRSLFTRDSEVKYSDEDSYKIENVDYNDAMFYKTIAVEPNTAYKVTCMVKTENVENEEGKIIGGAQIAINNTTECSGAVTGTTDWTELTFMFNSNNRTSVELGFRLGGYDECSKGTAWFSDFSIEEGAVDTDTNWHMACFFIENLDVDVNGENIKISMSSEDMSIMKSNMERLKNTIGNLSGNKMSITYDVINIEEPLTTLSYDEENKYYAGQKDVYPLINEYIKENEYDYIYVVVRLGDLAISDELLSDWIGLRSDGI